MKKVIVTADGKIPGGALVLVRGGRATVADKAVANGKADRPPSIMRQRKWRDGQTVPVQMLEGLGDRCLHALANGPIMDPASLYLPAGKVSLAEAMRRERALQVRDDG